MDVKKIVELLDLIIEACNAIKSQLPDQRPSEASPPPVDNPPSSEALRELTPEEYEAKVAAGKKIKLAKGGAH